jgi:hypothetical protein
MAAAPPELVASVRAADVEDAPDPSLGDLWRVAWDDQTALVVVLRAAQTEVVAAPVTADPGTGDQQSLTLEPKRTALGVPCAVWAGLARALPIRVLDVRIGGLELDVVAAVVELAEGVPAAPPAGTHVGAPIRSVFVPAARARAIQADKLERFAASEWAPAADFPRTTPRDVLGPDTDLDELSDLLGVPLPATWTLFLGKRPLSTSQAERIAMRYGVDIERLLASAALPSELVAELDHPRWRRDLRARQRALRLGDADVRRRVAQDTYALAARQTGEAVPAWRERLRHQFDAARR